MKDYKKIPFNKIKDIESYIERKLKSGHVIIQILVNEDNKEIDELISYANDKECKSGYRCLTDTDEQLKNSVITEMIEPYYAFKDINKSSDEMCCDIDIGLDSQNVIDFDVFKTDFSDMEKYFDGKSFQLSVTNCHYEFYISTRESNIDNFCGYMEVEFITEWMTEMGYYSKAM